MENKTDNKLSSRVLLVEDDTFISRAYSDFLKKSGYEVVCAYDGVEALKKMVEIHPDLVLLDMIMPLKNGFEVLEEMKNIPEISSIPVIVMSNLGQNADINKAKNLGAKEYLIKSNLSIKDIVNKVKAILETLEQ